MGTVDVKELENKVRDMYREVAGAPSVSFTFEMGRGLAGASATRPRGLDRIRRSLSSRSRASAITSAWPSSSRASTWSTSELGSGMDTFIAALHVGRRGRVLGVDMTDAQRSKAEEGYGERAGFARIRVPQGYIEELPVESASADCVIQQRRHQLSPAKARVFREAARVLKSGGRLAIIASSRRCYRRASCAKADLWAARASAAPQVDSRTERGSKPPAWSSIEERSKLGGFLSTAPRAR